MSTSSEANSGLPSESADGEATLITDQEAEPPAEEMQRVNFEVPRSKHVKLKVLAARRGLSIKEFLTEYIDSFPDE
jgi:hypothetical protein